MSNPVEAHQEAIKWLFKYINGTSNLGIQFRKQSDGIVLSRYTDFEYAGDTDN